MKEEGKILKNKNEEFELEKLDIEGGRSKKKVSNLGGDLSEKWKIYERNEERGRNLEILGRNWGESSEEVKRSGE